MVGIGLAWEAMLTMKTIHAVFENGIFRPTEPVHLPEGTRVEIATPENATAPPETAAMSDGLKRIYAILGERFSSGRTDIAARHDEHQPRHRSVWVASCCSPFG